MSVMVNGKTYDWGDITISLLPFSPVLVGCQSVSFDESLETQPVYGKGRAPVAFGTGKWNASGRITLLKTEFDVLHKLPNVQGILNLDPRITAINITYGSDLQGDLPPSSVTLQGIRFTKISESASSGDKEMKVNLDFLILGNILRDGRSSRGFQVG